MLIENKGKGIEKMGRICTRLIQDTGPLAERVQV